MKIDLQKPILGSAISEDSHPKYTARPDTIDPDIYPPFTMADRDNQYITLELVEEKDIMTLAQMSEDAFATDANTQLKYLGKPKGTFAKGMAEGIRSWFAQPDRCTVLKAVDTSSSNREITGWVCWVFSKDRNQASIPVSTPVTAPPSNTESIPIREDAERSSRLKDSNRSKAERLEELTSKDLERMMGVLMPPGTKCMYIGSVIVDPKHQGHGVGTKLIQWGTRKADEAGAFAWVHSSEAGAPRFEKQGFKEVARFEVDLDQYADSSREDGSNWGTYIFRYLKRAPRS
ncbi:hypothetical protein F5884DRAFT_755362 [Xylogone sp. PMI_703]|nr:hypothetical protein F5884DRAFT_755362 [Xylogone sp. PMI_703]